MLPFFRFSSYLFLLTNISQQKKQPQISIRDFLQQKGLSAAIPLAISCFSSRYIMMVFILPFSLSDILLDILSDILTDILLLSPNPFLIKIVVSNEHRIAQSLTGKVLSTDMSKASLKPPPKKPPPPHHTSRSSAHASLSPSPESRP